MSANAHKGDCRLSLEAGMNAYLSKSIDVQNLYRVLMKYIMDKR